MGMMQGKVALISGGAEGIGGATGRRIVAEGGSVVLGDVQFDKAKALASELGERAMAVSLDVRDLAQWEAAVQAAVLPVPAGRPAQQQRPAWLRASPLSWAPVPWARPWGQRRPSSCRWP